MTNASDFKHWLVLVIVNKFVEEDLWGKCNIRK